MDVNDFGPFQADVWGNVGDWVMIIVTIVTAYYLYQTLNSQNETMYLQKRITDIELHRHRLSIQPKFEVSFVRRDINFENGISSGNFTLKFFNTNRLARNVSIEVEAEAQLLFQPQFENPYTRAEFQPKDLLVLTAFMSISGFDTPRFQYPLRIELRYEDVSHNTYIQTISSIFTDSPEEDWIFYNDPELQVD